MDLRIKRCGMLKMGVLSPLKGGKNRISEVWEPIANQNRIFPKVAMGEG